MENCERLRIKLLGLVVLISLNACSTTKLVCPVNFDYKDVGIVNLNDYNVDRLYVYKTYCKENK